MQKAGRRLACLMVLVFAFNVMADEPTVAEVTHWELQAVNENGVGIYDATDKVIIMGIVLNNPEEMLDPTPGAGFMGGQWQIFVQGEGSDHAGTAVWLGQYYSRISSSDDYTDQELLSELCRINRDPNTGYIISAGDRVKITGWYMFHNGKLNINEKHQTDPFFNFQVELIEPAVGLPAPEVIKLSQLKDGNGFIFDSNRLTGCEYYQGRLVRVNDVNIISSNWQPNGKLVISDNNGHVFDVNLGYGEGFSKYPMPAGIIDVIGILNQESSSDTICKDGYHICVANYDGNGLVLTDRGYPRGNLPGDINKDYTVNFMDFAGLYGCCQ
jgi:hypothetical protein